MSGLLIDLGQLERDIETLASSGFCVTLEAIAAEAIPFLTPPERISTTDCAASSRYIATATGGRRLWSRSITPYVVMPQDMLDHPDCRTVVVVGPARCGKTEIPLNHLHKRLKYGPRTDVLWFLPGAAEVSDFADKEFKSYFELHPDIAAKIGGGRSDDKRTLKRVSGRFISILPANRNTIRMRQAPLVVADEIDGFRKSLRSNFKQQMDIRRRAFGAAGKAYMCSHPDAGWSDGIAAAWKESSRGIYWWQCPHCTGWSSPCPTAEWRTTLTFTRDRDLARDAMLERVRETAGLMCPHCGAVITEDHKAWMLEGGKWVFEGQTIGVDGSVTGSPSQIETMGFWIHGTMSPFVSWGDLAKEYVAALVFFEDTGKADRLREVTAKSLGECYEGPTGKRATAKALALRAAGAEGDGYALRTIPPGVRFLTATADTGGNGWDIAIVGWGKDAESWLIDRYKLVAGPDGRKLSPGTRLDDWNCLRRVLDRSYPFRDRPNVHLPVASLGVDIHGVPGAAWNARRWASVMVKGPCAGANAYKLRLLKGSNSDRAPEIGQPRAIDRDDQGKPIEPLVFEHVLGVFRLKETILDRLSIDAPGPGHIHFPKDCPPEVFAELLAEPLIDGKFVRQGPNETLDLFGYAEAVRLMLKPERPGIDWSRPPVWARPFDKTETQDARPDADRRPRADAVRERLLEKMRR